MTDDRNVPPDDVSDRAGEAGRAPGVAPRVSPGERWHLIAEAAYYRARARGFRDGSPAEDWRAAAAEVDRRLAGEGDAGARASAADDERAVYRQLRDELQRRLAAIRGNVDARAIQDAFERATAQVRRAGEHAGTSVTRAAERLRKDMSQAAGAIGPRWEELSGRAAGVFSVWRDRGGEFLARAASGVNDWLNRSGRRGGSAYHTRTIVSAGTFQCARCGRLIPMESGGPLPACPDCRHTEFRRVP